MNVETFCPHCGNSMQGTEIPDRPGEHYGRNIGVEIPGVYDGVLFWACPDCGGTWHRWEDPRMRAKAEPYMTHKWCVP